jgi:mannose-6-phosphate isomerase-like protein (cupin superfamily)
VRELAGAGVFTAPDARESVHWVEHLSVPDLSVGTYSIPRGGDDGQQPHTEDEIYVVTSGRAVFEAADRSVSVGPGSVLYVPAGERHRFTGISEDLAVLVVFAPAECSRGRAAG